jgi:hypothetical protein
MVSGSELFELLNALKDITNTRECVENKARMETHVKVLF